MTYRYKAIMSALCALGLSASGHAKAFAFDRSATNVQHDLEKKLGCHWQGTPTRRVCALRDVRGSLQIDLTTDHRRIETVELIVMIAGHPYPKPQHEARGRSVTGRIMEYFFPRWKDGRSWAAAALEKARRHDSPSLIRVGDVAVFVRRLQPVDLDDTFADVVITKKAAAEGWEKGDR